LMVLMAAPVPAIFRNLRREMVFLLKLLNIFLLNCENLGCNPVNYAQDRLFALVFFQIRPPLTLLP
ncbi:MAG: hypothetical protein WCL57_15180, partial [Chloroflexota bacterium]